MKPTYYDIFALLALNIGLAVDYFKTRKRVEHLESEVAALKTLISN